MRAFSTLAAVWAAASAVLAAPLAAPAPQELTLTPSVDGSDVGIKKAGTPDTKFSISSFDLPDIYNISTIFSLTVGGQKIPVVSNTDYEYARFAMPVPSSPVLVEIQTMSGLLPKSATVSPRKFGIPAWVSGNKVSFKLNGRYYLIVKISDRKELVIMIDGPETDTKPSSTGKNIFNIKDAKYKPAKANDPVSQTQAFQKALDDATAAWKQGQPQSVVYVPAGVYDVGNLILKSNTALYLESGAALRFYGKDSKKAYYKGSQGRWVTWWISTAFDSENISVYGRGVLDANGVQSIADWKMGNNVLVPIQTKNFKFDGLILTNSAAWSFTPIRCDGVEISNVKIMNRQWQKGMGEVCIMVLDESQAYAYQKNRTTVLTSCTARMCTFTAVSAFLSTTRGPPRPGPMVPISPRTGHGVPMEPSKTFVSKILSAGQSATASRSAPVSTKTRRTSLSLRDMSTMLLLDWG